MSNIQGPALEALLTRERQIAAACLHARADQRIRSALLQRALPWPRRTVRSWALATSVFFGGLTPWGVVHCQASVGVPACEAVPQTACAEVSGVEDFDVTHVGANAPRASLSKAAQLRVESQ